MRAFFQSDADEDTYCKCVCGQSMKVLYLPSDSQYLPPVGFLPLSQLPGFCSICRVQLLPNSYAFECKLKSDKHPAEPYRICYRCAKYTQKAQAKSKENSFGKSQPKTIVDPNYYPYHESYYNHPIRPSSERISYFNRFLNTKHKQKHYEQVHQLINHASDSSINALFDQLATLSSHKKRHLLHTIYDHFDADNAAKYDFIQPNDNTHDIEEKDIDCIAIGPSRFVQNNSKRSSIMKDVKQNIIKEDHLIAGNLNISYENDDDFILKNAHLWEQQEKELERIQMEQIKQQMARIQISDCEDIDDEKDTTNHITSPQISEQLNNNEDIELSESSPSQRNSLPSYLHESDPPKEEKQITLDSDDDVDLSGIQFDTNHIDEQGDEKLDALGLCLRAFEGSDTESSDTMRFNKTGDLRIVELEELFNCTTGNNLTEQLGQDLWWYRVFVFLPKPQLSNMLLTCRYFYYMKVFHELIDDHMIRISSLPALVWKLAIFKDFKIEEKFTKCMNYIRIRFMKSMDWSAKLSPQYLQQWDLIQLPDTKQVYVEYCSIHHDFMNEGFETMINMMFCDLFANIKSIDYVELINKTNPKQQFTWKLKSFGHVTSSLNNFTRIKVPCWNQEIFNPRIYSWNENLFRLNTARNIEYIYLSDMQFENFAALLPNDNGGVDAVNYFEQLQKLRGIVLIFGEDITKKVQEMSSVSEAILSFLEIIRDTVQYIVIGVNGIRNYIHNPFTERNQYSEYMDEEYMDEATVLPECYQLFEFNYAFKEEINKIFWTNYSNPDQVYKEQKKLELMKQKEKQQKAIEDAMKSLIQFELHKYENVENVQLTEQDEDEEDANGNEQDMEIIEMSDEESDDEHPRHMVQDKEEKKAEEEEEEKASSENTLQELGEKLRKYQKQFKCPRGRAAFIVLYNTQIYLENDSKESGNIPLNTDARGQWECPFCTVWNARLERRCYMCSKKKPKYIPQEPLIQQRAADDQKGEFIHLSSGWWDCPICQGKNSDDLTNCKLCTFERPQDYDL